MQTTNPAVIIILRRSEFATSNVDRDIFGMGRYLGSSRGGTHKMLGAEFRVSKVKVCIPLFLLLLVL